MFILQDFFFISSAFLSKSRGDCVYESREARQDAQPRYFENREVPGNKVGETRGRRGVGEGLSGFLNYKQQRQQRLFCTV